MPDDITHEVTLPHSPQAVWEALTTREAMSAWLMETTFEKPEVGHRFEFRDKPKPVLGWDGVVACEVLEVEPGRRLVIRFGDGTGGFPVTRLIWDLEPASEGTRVRFRHEGFTGFKGWLMRKGMSNGWVWIHAHAIPIVLEHLAKGEVPDQAFVRDESKRRVRAERAARRAQP